MKFQKKSEKRFIKNSIRFTAILILCFLLAFVAIFVAGLFT